MRALRTFQRRHDLRETGKADRATWTVLFATGSTPLLKVGSSGASALPVQRALRAGGAPDRRALTLGFTRPGGAGR